MSPNRLVAVLTPLVFAPAAGACAAWLAEHFPGIDIPADKLQAIFIAGALIAFGKSAQWLHGWQQYEQREAAATERATALDQESAIAAQTAAAPATVPAGDTFAEDDLGVDDVAFDDAAFDDEAFDDEDLDAADDPLIGRPVA